MKNLTVLAAGLLLLAPSPAFPDSFQMRLGYFMPGASSNIALHPDSLWAIEFDQMTFTRTDFRGTIMGGGYERFLGKKLSLALSLDVYSKARLGDYLAYDQTELDEGWFAFPIDEEPAAIEDWYYISHSLKVSNVPLQVSLKLAPLGRKVRLIPFVGGGASLYFWSVRMLGDMVDFNPLDEFGEPVEYYYPDPELGDVIVYPVEYVYAKESGVAFGYHAFAGLQFPIGYRATIEAEVRYHGAKARLKEWFEGFEDFDLGGLALTVGFSYWF